METLEPVSQGIGKPVIFSEPHPGATAGGDDLLMQV